MAHTLLWLCRASLLLLFSTVKEEHTLGSKEKSALASQLGVLVAALEQSGSGDSFPPTGWPEKTRAVVVASVQTPTSQQQGPSGSATPPETRLLSTALLQPQDARSSLGLARARCCHWAPPVSTREGHWAERGTPVGLSHPRSEPHFLAKADGQGKSSSAWLHLWPARGAAAGGGPSSAPHCPDLLPLAPRATRSRAPRCVPPALPLRPSALLFLASPCLPRFSNICYLPPSGHPLQLGLLPAAP